MARLHMAIRTDGEYAPLGAITLCETPPHLANIILSWMRIACLKWRVVHEQDDWAVVLAPVSRSNQARRRGGNMRRRGFLAFTWCPARETARTGCQKPLWTKTVAIAGRSAGSLAKAARIRRDCPTIDARGILRIFDFGRITAQF